MSTSVSGTTRAHKKARKYPSEEYVLYNQVQLQRTDAESGINQDVKEQETEDEQ